jgi:chemotaxis protein CheD
MMALARPLPRTTVFLCAGDFHFGSGIVRLKTVLGTCIAISMWHPQRRIGGLCHFMLPTRTSTGAQAPPGLYADEVMELFVGAVRKNDSKPAEYIVKVFGGGNMFPDRADARRCPGVGCTDARRSACVHVGCQNVAAAHRLLALRGFSILSEDVGGDGSRQILFDLDDGNVWVSRGAAMESS